MMLYVDIMTNKLDGILYIGVGHRVLDPKEGIVDSFKKRYQTLVFYEFFETAYEAIQQ